MCLRTRTNAMSEHLAAYARAHIQLPKYTRVSYAHMYAHLHLPYTTHTAAILSLRSPHASASGEPVLTTTCSSSVPSPAASHL